MKTGRKNAFRQQAKQSISRQPASSVPSTLDILLQKATAHHKAGQLPQAEALYRQILQLSPLHADALHLLGVIACQVGQCATAIELIDRAIQINPDFAEAYYSRGNALYILQQCDTAIESYDKAILLKPDHAEAHHNRGSALHALQQFQAALHSFDKAVLLKPDYAEAYYNRGNTLVVLRQYQAALHSYDKAILFKPEYAEAYNNRGNALHALQQYDAAIESCARAILLKPDYAEACCNRGNMLFFLQQYQEALEGYDKAILLKPDYAEAFNNRGGALHALTQYQEALDSFDKAIRLKPDYAEARGNRANTLQALKQYQAALKNYEKALRLNPDDESRKKSRVIESVGKEVARIAKIKSKPEMKAALDALPPDMVSHPAVCSLRNANFVKTESSGKDLVFYCALTDEIWNPQTARTIGIGGSEEAVIWLSRLLHRRGWNVTVYASCGAREVDCDGVLWKPYWMWNHRDKQNVTVIWRHPLLTTYEINSDKVIVDLHDTIAEEELTPERLCKIHKIVVKSRFHRSLYPGVPDEKFLIIPNGIDAKLFEGAANRDPLLLINTSSADRSLAAFVDCFEEIKKQVPNAKAQWAYGWGVWDLAFASNAERMEWKHRMQRRMKEVGIEELGRLSHGEIAQLYPKANIFAYPSEMAEIDCISLSKAMAAGAMPVTTDFAAMGEKSQHGGVFIHSTKTKDDWIESDQFHYEITDPEQKAEFVRETVKLLLNPPSETARESMRDWARFTFDWNKIADSWNSALTSQTAEFAPAPGPVVSANQEYPGSAEFDFNRGNAHYLAQQYEAALESYDKALLLNPLYADVYNNRGSALHALQQYQPALENFDKAILLKPDYPEACNNRGNTLVVLRQYQAALESFDKAIRLKPDYAEAYSNRGNTLFVLQQYQSALESCDMAILLKPELADAHFNRGKALQALKQYDAALVSCDKAILFKPELAEAYSNRGNALHALQQYHAALECYDKAILLKPEYADAYSNRGNTLQALMQYQAALECYDMAILLKPEYADACYNRGNTLLALKQYNAALESYDMAILLNPNHADAHCNRGNTLQDLKQFPEALESYDKALLIKPDYEYLPGMRLYIKRLLCDWENIESECRQLVAFVVRGLKVAPPFAMLAISGSPAVQKQAAEIYVRDKHPESSTAAAIPRRPRHNRIRIGYFSADYYKHAMSFLMAELYEQHDRSRFEILGFAFGPNKFDEMSKRISSAMDQFLDLRSMPDREAAELSRKLEVDIAVDLNGFTNNCRPGIFAERAAPTQVNYLGYPGTMGANYIDYLVADHTLVPESEQRHYSEKIICLPDTYQVNDSLRSISTKSCARASEGLPESAFVFCCFNNAYKISPSVFDIWMRVLGRVEGSVLWLMEDSPWAVDNLRKEARRRGIAPDRLVFAKSLPVAEHLARQRLADLFLDTLPYNAHTTASDALWAGLPVLTRTGDTFASRVAASLLRAVGLPELITATESEFEELAVDLAHNPQRLQALRHRLQQNHRTAPLFDCRSFTRHLEAAYSAIYERYHAGLPPDHIHIPRLPSRP